MFYLHVTIVNKILRHCHSWLARQYRTYNDTLPQMNILNTIIPYLYFMQLRVTCLFQLVCQP